jgi:hypothetical protein
MTRPTIRIERGGRVEIVDLDEVLDGDLGERAATDANAWIKSLRHAAVDGRSFRDRFTYRGDSLWWFAELFLHKEGVVLEWQRAALALDAICRAGQPGAIGLDSPDRVLAQLVSQVAARYGCGVLPPAAEPHETAVRLAKAVKGRFYTWSALATRWMGSGVSRPEVTTGGTLAFVHSAFWRPGVGAAQGAADGEEGYIGPILQALEQDARARPLRLIGVGPTKNFRARRWWHPLAPSMRAARASLPVAPVEQFATRAALAGSIEVWRARAAHAQALVGSEDLRTRAVASGYDVWPLLADELRGIAELQFPWSARAMDEAAAAIDACRPRAVVTYAEAGGWGRALMLEARRRDIASVGVQHGFIYRHWLNYRHEADEMQPSPGNAGDRGFPRPDRTLLFDGYAAAHLRTAGRFPADSLCVTGSPSLDRLSASLAAITPETREAVRSALGAGADHIAVVVSKHSQIGRELPALIDAAETTPGLLLVIKPHPAETAEPYQAAIGRSTGGGARRVRIAPPELDLARLLSIARGLVTVNSTVAVDAMVLGIPALIVGLPNNLSPFVEAGALAGAFPGTLAGRETGATLSRLCVDEAWRGSLLDRARQFAAQWDMRSDGQAAARAADAIARLGRG